MPVKAPPPVIAPTWTGFYIGIHGGADWFDKNWFTPLTPINTANGGCFGCPAPAGSHRSSSWLFGGQVGFKHQVGWLVWGVEAQAGGTRLEGSNVNLLSPTVTIHSKTNSLGTVAARLGVGWDRLLLYGKGGGAWAHDNFWTTFAGFPDSVSQTRTETRWGWMTGVGVEYAFLGNWSLKFEYDHIDLGRRRETLVPSAACLALGCAPFQYDVRQTVDLIKIGLNYRLAWGPVVAKF